MMWTMFVDKAMALRTNPLPSSKSTKMLCSWIIRYPPHPYLQHILGFNFKDSDLERRCLPVWWSHLLTHCLLIPFSLFPRATTFILHPLILHITVPHVCGSWMIVNYLNLWETLLFLVWNHGEAKPLSAPLFCTAAHHNPHSQTQYFARPHWPGGFFGLTLLLYMPL